MIFISRSPKEIKEIAKKILKKFQGFNVFSLEGELGGGKTTFVKGIADFLGVKEPIKSPTFVIMRKYRMPIKSRQQIADDKWQIIDKGKKSQEKNTSCNFRYLYHFDCYRIKDSKEILELGWQELVKNSKNLIFVEWGDKIKNILPKNTLHLKFEFLKENERKIIIK